jgi:hypothetical protein
MKTTQMYLFNDAYHALNKAEVATAAARECLNKETATAAFEAAWIATSIAAELQNAAQEMAKDLREAAQAAVLAIHTL